MNFKFDNIPAKPVSAFGEPELVSTIVSLLSAAPRALTLKEVIMVLNDSDIETPAATTVRTYLNRAVEDGRISKPSRQTYAGPAMPEAEVSEVDTAEMFDEVTAEDDPLAGL